MSDMIGPRTLLFCTSYGSHWTAWEKRYRTWLRAIRSTKLRQDRILIIDDGSPALPPWNDIKIVNSLDHEATDAPIILHHFHTNLGNLRGTWYLGWVRSFLYAAQYARWHGFDKVVHIESDAFLITERICDYFNQINNQWVTLWCPRHSMPESGIQVIAGSALRTYFDLSNAGISALIGKSAELDYPRDLVEKRFIGDRYGEYLDHVPKDADYVMQAHSVHMASRQYLWWVPDAAFAS